MVLPAAVAFGAIALLVYDHYARTAVWAVWLASAALVVCMARAGLTFRENIAQSVTDTLTGLPNRRLFHDRVEQAINRARRQGERAAVMIIDLDRFKEVNDTLGHRCGDLLLEEIARRLRGALRESDTVARLGGDEFAVLLPSVPDVASAERVAIELGRVISESIVVEGVSLDTEASIGITLFPDHGTDVSELLQRADVAMYTAKSESLPLSVYGAAQDSYSPERLALVGELRRAIEQGELVLHYQPKVRLMSGELLGAEALVRWQHPERGLLPPSEFIPLAEHTTLIKPLTLYVLERALQECRRWEGDGHRLSVAVNISARNLLDERPEDRSLLRAQDVDERGGRDDRALDHRPGSQPRPPGGRRGGREPGGPRRPPGARMRYRAGLPHRASHGEGGVRAMDRRGWPPEKLPDRCVDLSRRALRG